MTRISDRFLQLAVLFGLVGMGLGVWMGKTETFTLMPVHAHVNLLGWVSMALYALVYRAIPRAAEGRLPVVHFWLSVLSLLAMIPTLGLMVLGNTAFAPAVGLVSIALWAGMAVFAVIVFKATWKA
jgi:cbb3-type cytochrome oxidase subunit 1